MVGGIGIGAELVGSLRILDCPQVLALLNAILVTVTIVNPPSNLPSKLYT